MNDKLRNPPEALKRVVFMSLLFLGMFVSTTDANELIVNVSEIPPCAIYEGDSIRGFSIDLWERCANELELKYHYNRVSFADKLRMVIHGEADVAIAGISITEEREKQLDFTLPTLDSGLKILVMRDENLLPTLSHKSKRMLLYLLGFLVLFGHILWLSERGREAINDRYFPGIFEAFWCVFATMTTVGYGDISPKKWLGRAMAVLIMFAGISFFGILIATLTADFVAEKRISNISSYRDLIPLKVGTKEETTSEHFLRELVPDIVTFATIQDACDELLARRLDAVVYDAPTLLYLAGKDKRLATVGETFAPQYYGFVFAEGNDVVEKFNQVLLKFKENGVYNSIYNQWFESD